MEKRKKCYISVPMDGREASEIHRALGLAAAELIERGYLPVSPWDTKVNPDLSEPLPVLMGNDIRALLECEAVCYIGTAKEFDEHKGCQVEMFTATAYGKEIVKL